MTKRRLFWKIVAGFWLTFFISVQGIWLLFLLLRPLGEQSDYVKTAKVTVTATALLIEQRGEESVASQFGARSPDAQGLRIQKLTDARPEGRAPVAQAIATSPRGQRYLVAYYPARFRPINILHVPAEVLVVGGVGGLVFSAILAWYLTRPVEQIRRGFAEVAKGKFGTRMAQSVGRRRDEIADLARDFDQMVMRLEELVGARDRLLADVSHELRTPLARLNLAIGLARQDPSRSAASLERIAAEAAKLDDMVGELLTLAKLEGSAEGEDEYVNLADLLGALVQDASFEAAAKGVRTQLVVPPSPDAEDWTVRGSGKLIYRAVENIVRNAVRYSPQGGLVTVSLGRSDAGTYSIRVSDQGAGVADSDIAKLFQPFGLSADGSGFGLGLAIAQRAIAVNGGAISVRNREPGLEMEIRLPAAAIA
jgi:two-component system OmpR family sensor kinase